MVVIIKFLILRNPCAYYRDDGIESYSETKESTGDQTKRAGRKSAMSNSNFCWVDYVEAGEENINK